MHFHLLLKTIMGTHKELHYQAIYNNSFGKLLIMTFKNTEKLLCYDGSNNTQTFEYNKEKTTETFSLGEKVMLKKYELIYVIQSIIGAKAAFSNYTQYSSSSHAQTHGPKFRT